MSNLPKDLLGSIKALQASLDEEYFAFVSDEIDQILEQPVGRRAQLVALLDVVRKLGLTTTILANAASNEIDQVEAAIEIHLRTAFDA